MNTKTRNKPFLFLIYFLLMWTNLQGHPHEAGPIHLFTDLQRNGTCAVVQDLSYAFDLCVRLVFEQQRNHLPIIEVKSRSNLPDIILVNTDPLIPINCMKNRGLGVSKDLLAFPKRVDAGHLLHCEVDIKPKIRFRHTGNGEALTVMIWASLPYPSEILRDYVLECFLNNMMPPDSTVNKKPSRGDKSCSFAVDERQLSTISFPS